MAVARDDSTGALRRGWTTGACATAATRAAYAALLTGTFPDPVRITLPKGETPDFALATEAMGEGWARAGIVKDAGDDPDVTHGALVVSTVRHGRKGAGVSFTAGLLYRYPGATLLLRSPALETLSHLADRLPMLRTPTVVDRAPLLSGSRR